MLIKWKDNKTVMWRVIGIRILGGKSCLISLASIVLLISSLISPSSLQDNNIHSKILPLLPLYPVEETHCPQRK